MINKFKGQASYQLLGFLHDSFHDYLSARLLFLNDHLTQACFLSNTAIEKALKARLFISNIPFGKIHNCIELYNSVENVSHFLQGNLNREYLEALNIIYKGRYLGDQVPGFHFTIVKRKFLAELDYTIDTINQSMAIQNCNDMNIYKRESITPILKPLNYILNAIDKTSFCEQEDIVLDYVLLKTFEDRNMQYLTPNSKNDGIFLYDSINKDDDQNSKPSHWPFRL